MNLTVATHNLPGRVGPAAQQDALAALAHAADVICLQEGGWLVRNPDRTPDGFTLEHGAHDALPILYRTDRFQVTGRLERRAYPDTEVGPWGAGPPEMKAGWDYGIRLEDQPTGTNLWVLNAHLVPSVTQNQPANQRDAATWEKRRALYRAEIRQLADITSWINREPCFVCGDFNAGPDFPLLAPMRQAFAPATTRSHGQARLDYIWHRHAVLGRVWEQPTGSDHDAVLAAFTL